MDYEKLLDDAYKKLPKVDKVVERFEIPPVLGHIQGNKTVVTNFFKIVGILRRDHNHLLKYLLRELATPGVIEGQRLVLGRKISSGLINNKVEQYANEFVLCPECKKPDTILKKEERVLTIKCMACGAKHTIKSKI